MGVCYLTTNLQIPVGTTEVQQGLELLCQVSVGIPHTPQSCSALQQAHTDKTVEPPIGNYL